MALPPPPPGIGPPKPAAPANGATPGATAVTAMVSTPPPPKKRAPVVMDEDEFDFSVDDVKNAASDLMKMLPDQKAIVSSGPIVCAMVVGDRDCKTISSLPVGTSHCAGLPRPEGSIVVSVHFDTQGESSFDNFLSKSGVALASETERPYFISMRQPRGRFKGLVNAEDPANLAYIAMVFRELMKGLRARQDVGGFHVDHYGIFIETHGNDYALYQAGVRNFSDLNPTDWMPRKKLWAGTDELIRSTPIPGGWVVVTGYRNRDDGDEQTVIGPGGKRTKAVVEAKWTRRVFANWPIIVQTYHTQDDEGRHGWHGECSTGRWEGFQAGVKRDLKNRHIGSFLLKE